MYKILKKWIILMIMFGGLWGTEQISAEESDPVYEKIIEKGELTVGLSADYAPYEFHTEIDGKDKIVGFDISIAEKIADDLNVQLKIDELGFDALLGALKTGKIDLIISGMAATEERKKEVNFSNPYMHVQQKMIVRKEDQDKFRSLSDFTNVAVGVQKQTTQEELAKNELIGSKPISLQKVPDVVLNLTQKKVDAIILEGPVAEAYLSQDDRLVFADINFEQGEKETAIAVSKSSPILLKKVNESIADITEHGLLEKYQKEAATLMFQPNQNFFEKYGMYYVRGAGYTILLSIVGVLCGGILGSFLALMKISKKKFIRFFSSLYVEYVRGTPLLVQIFIVYFGTSMFGWDVSKLAAGCIALALNCAAYVAEIIRAGINAVDKGQMEAARSLGMTHLKALRLIVLPQAIKNILPALGNEFVTVIKETSIVSVIGVSELIFESGNIAGASFKPFLPYAVVSVVYFILTFTSSRLLAIAEKRMGISDGGKT